MTSIARLSRRAARTTARRAFARTITRTTMRRSSSTRTGTTSRWFAMNRAPDVTEALKELYAALNRNDIEAAVNALDPQIAWIEPAEYTGGATVHGREAVAAHLKRARATWAEGSCEPERFVVAGDKVVVFIHVHVRLKTETEFRDGRHAAVYTFRDGKAIEMRIFDDERDALEWAGVGQSVQ